MKHNFLQHLMRTRRRMADGGMVSSDDLTREGIGAAQASMRDPESVLNAARARNSAELQSATRAQMAKVQGASAGAATGKSVGAMARGETDNAQKTVPSSSDSVGAMAHGERETRNRLGINRETLVRIEAGLPVRPGSIALVEKQLATLNEKQVA